MIKINLLPYHETEKKVSQAKQVVIFVGSFLVFISIVAILHLYMVARITLLESDIQSSEQQVAELTKIVGNIENYKVDKRNLENKINVIAKLEEGRTFPVYMLSQLAAIVPVKDLWLERISQTGSSISLEGKARNTVVVALFMKSLEFVPFIGSVDLVSSKQDEFSSIKVQSFKLNCAIKKG
jgi:type IV pilus assembly protein PilN